MTLRTSKYEISSNLGHYRTCAVSDLKTETSRMELLLDTLQLTGISTSDGISQSNVTL
jgi:hypothetical protein